MNENKNKEKEKEKEKRSIKVWISGAFRHRERMSELIDRVRQMGYIITHDWTRVEKSANPTPQEMSTYAKFDIDGVKNADIAVAVLEDPDYLYRGTYTEIGCALGAMKPTHIVWPYDLDDQNYQEKNAQIIFFWHPDITIHKSFEDFETYLKKKYPLE